MAWDIVCPQGPVGVIPTTLLLATFHTRTFYGLSAGGLQ
jgi:hypothetical protein